MKQDIGKQGAQRLGLIGLEIAMIVLVCFLFAGSPPPGVNEAHYLAKAKQYWEPSWCPGDPFLESADAHLVFYWSFGWLTKLFSLTTCAWIGRFLTWALLAWAWRRLSWTIWPKQWMGLISAALFLSLLHYGHMAGEWVVGGVEAKGFAYVLLLVGLKELLENRWSRVWLYFGASAAFHVLVGGWAVVAAGIAWLLMRDERPKLVSMLPWLVIGGLLSLPGLLPGLALNRGVDSEVVKQAQIIYVYHRLPHHLVINHFSHWLIARHVLLLCVWVAFQYLLDARAVDRRLRLFVAAAVGIGCMGIVIDQTIPFFNIDLAATLLRFYWYRLSDVMIPMGTALTGMALILQWEKTRPHAAQRTLAIVLVFCMIVIGVQFAVHQEQKLSDADSQSQIENIDQWRDSCDWIARETPSDALVLTPWNQQTFRWYAGRAEVFNWKDVPQDGAAIVAWSERGKKLRPWYEGESVLRRYRLAEEYQCDYLLMMKSETNSRHSAFRETGWPIYQNEHYEVYKIQKLKSAKDLSKPSG